MNECKYRHRYYGLLLYTNKWYKLISKMCVGLKTPRFMRGVKTMKPLDWSVSILAAAFKCVEETKNNKIMKK